MEGLKLIPMIALVIAIAGIVIGASAVTLSKFSETVTDSCYNTSYSYSTTDEVCRNNSLMSFSTTDPLEDNLSREKFTIKQSIEAEGDIAEQLPTVAIIGVMVIIISIIAGVFVYMKYFS